MVLPEIIRGIRGLFVKAKTNNGSTNLFEGLDSDNAKQFEIRSNGHYRTSGNAWKDMIMDLFGRQLFTTPGKVDYDFDENAMLFQANGNINASGDRVGGNQEINHEFLVGTSITFKPHIHWWQQVAANAVAAHTFTARWRLQRNGFPKETTWNTILCKTGAGGDDVWDFTAQPNGLYNQISKFESIVIDCGISDTIQIQLTRSDAIAGDIPVTFFDIHGRVDSDGSDQEVHKT